MSLKAELRRDVKLMMKDSLDSPVESAAVVVRAQQTIKMADVCHFNHSVRDVVC